MKRYKLQYNFKDGTIWGGSDVDVRLTAQEISVMLQQDLMNNPDTELESQKTGEKKKVGEIKSIEIMF